MTYVPRSSLLATGAFALLLAVLGGCGRTDLGSIGAGGFGGSIIATGGSVASTGGSGVGAGGSGPTCGDKVCDDGETCETCPIDCGLCPTCGDGTCDNGETCSNCPQDCGVCSTCGDGKCTPPETCLSCAPDCGPCPSCGDGTCTPPGENCYTCPADCGKCMGCGDGICESDETCASCPQDCGLCDVCGNGVCQMGETCTNCPQDCGQCSMMPTTCLEAVTCAFACFDFTSKPPMIDFSCAANCVAEACANGQYFADQVVDCAIDSLGMCIGMGGGGITGCLMSQCSSQIAACIGSHCQ